MFNYPDWIIYLWLAAVFITIALPLLLMSSEWFLEAFIKMTKKGVKVKEKASFVADQPERQLPVFDKRHHPRLKVDGVVAHISDGMSCCEGLVNDVSEFGICLRNPADKLDRKAEKLGVLLIGYGKYFQVQVKPKWERGDGLEESIGVEIEDAHWNWDEFKEDIGI